MPMLSREYPVLGLKLTCGDEIETKWDRGLQRDVWTGMHRVREEVAIPFNHDRFNNSIGRLMGPNGATIKWLRKEHGCTITADIGEPQDERIAGKVTISTVGVHEVAAGRVKATLKDIVALFDDKDPRNSVLALFQSNCRGQILSGFPIEWRLRNFRTNPGGPVNEVATYYQQGLGNHRTFGIQAVVDQSLHPGFDLAERLSQTAVRPSGPQNHVQAPFRPTFPPSLSGNLIISNQAAHGSVSRLQLLPAHPMLRPVQPVFANAVNDNQIFGAPRFALGPMWRF